MADQNSLNSLVDSWFDNNQQMAELRAELKELTEAKKQYEAEIIGIMESKGVNKHSTGAGTLELIRKEKRKTTASKKQLKEIFETAEDGAINITRPVEACDYIFSLFPAEEHISLKAAKTDLP